MAEPVSIHERMAAIVAELPAIGKGQKNLQQNFMYRGHDDVLNALNPLLSSHQVFFAPTVLERVTDRRTTKQGTVMYEVNLHVRYRFYGPGGDYVEASAWGEGTDSGDKATNKAMTMALKNVIAQVFAVSTEERAGFDTDGGSDPATVKEPASGSAGPAKRARKPEAKRAASGSAAGEVDRDNEDSPYASEAQRKELFKTAKANGVSNPRLKELVQMVTGQGATAQIPVELYDKVVLAVELEGVPFA